MQKAKPDETENVLKNLWDAIMWLFLICVFINIHTQFATNGHQINHVELQMPPRRIVSLCSYKLPRKKLITVKSNEHFSKFSACDNND